MSGSKVHSWKILIMGRGQQAVDKAEQNLHELGYKNVKGISLTNDKESDDKLIEILKSDDWDGVSFGGGINGFDDRFKKEVTTLHWFNRLVNLVREYAPKAKVIFVTSPDDLIDSFERVLGSMETPVQTI